MSTDELKLAFDIIQTAATLGLGAWLYLEKKRDTTTATIDHLRTSVDTRLDSHATALARLEAVASGCEDAHETCPLHGERLARLEHAIESSPSHDDLGAIHERINHVASGVNHISGEFAGVRHLLNTIHQHLLSGSKK